MPARAEKLRDSSPIKDSEDAAARCNELEADLAELRAAYDLYFQGVERLPPLKKHDLFKKGFAKLKGTFVRQTAAKFRIETIGQKLMTYERLWERTIKEIESGTSRRDVARLKRRGMGTGTKKSADADSDFDVDEDLDLSDLDEGDGDLSAALAAAEAAVSVKPAAPAAAIPAIKPVTGLVPAITPVTPAKGVGIAPSITPVTPAGGVKLPTAPPAKPMITAAPIGGAKPVAPGIAPAVKPAAPGLTGINAAFKPPQSGSNPALRPAVTGSNPALVRAGSSGDGGLSDTKIKAIFDAYVMAKKRCGEDTRAVTYDSVATSLKKQVPELMKQHNARSVEFKVVIKDGKAVLRALPKEE